MVKFGLAAAANILSIGGNLILMTLKLVIGFIFGSISLIADGFDSVLDLVSATIAGFGERISRKPADFDHPFGHHKFQTISSLAIVTTMLLSSYFIADDAISKLIVGVSYDLDILILVAAIISFAGKILLFLGLMIIGKKLNSPVFIANAKNYRTDAVSSVFVGFAYLGVKLNVWWLDPAFALVIVCLILYTGYEITKSSLPELLDKGPPQEILDKLKKIVLGHDQVEEVHIIRLRLSLGAYTGDFHILVNPKLSIVEAHEISERIKAELEEDDDFRDLIIHIEPALPEEFLEKKG
jgi:cation diffusion facilitator family transporter